MLFNLHITPDYRFTANAGYSQLDGGLHRQWPTMSGLCEAAIITTHISVDERNQHPFPLPASQY